MLFCRIFNQLFKPSHSHGCSLLLFLDLFVNNEIIHNLSMDFMNLSLNQDYFDKLKYLKLTS